MVQAGWLWRKEGGTVGKAGFYVPYPSVGVTVGPWEEEPYEARWLDRGGLEGGL